MNAVILTALWGFPVLALAQNPVTLPAVAVHSPRVANQTPGGTFAMPVSALRFEPMVDIQPRNLAEGQADITLRGGIFENTGFQIGAVTVGDPQTGHYFAELPVAPMMLGAPEIVTGADLIFGATNATVGTVRQGWRPIRAAGFLSLGLGENRLRRGDLYQGHVRSLNIQTQLGADVSLAHSQSDGSVPFGEHRFDRINARFQLVQGRAQTDLFAGYQAKFFGWPNLYTPFNSNETENLQTSLFVLNHRMTLESGDFLEAGLYHRRNKDDYAFNRFAPVGPVHPFQHTTWVTGGAVTGRQTIGAVAFNYRAEHLADKLESTSLLFGRFTTRRFTKLALVPEKTWGEPAGNRTTARAGIAFDDTNRDSSAVSPVFELVRTFPSDRLRRVHASFTETSQVATYTALNSSATAGLFRGNPDLGRQTSRNFELGVAAQIAGWNGSAAVFFRRDRALVDWTFRRGVTARTANAVDVDVGGLELVGRRSWSRVDVTLGYTGLTKEADYRVATVDASFYALNYARHRFTAALTARLGHGLEVRFDNVARVQAANLLRTIGGDEALSSAIGLSYRPRAWRGLEVALQVENLWDTDFQDVPAVPAARRQTSVRVAYGW
jgi:outer membrane receptor protein involved in Fe transport